MKAFEAVEDVLRLEVPIPCLLGRQARNSAHPGSRPRDNLKGESSFLPEAGRGAGLFLEPLAGARAAEAFVEGCVFRPAMV
jgi:hypothetical protein